MLKGYWQVRLTKSACKICYFITTSGLYHLYHFRLKKVPAKFQHLMNQVFSSFNGNVFYLDDVLLSIVIRGMSMSNVFRDCLVACPGILLP